MLVNPKGSGLKCLAVVVMCAIMSTAACSRNAVHSRGANLDGSVVVSPLSVIADEPRDLLKVNSVVIQKPSFGAGVRSEVSEDALMAIVAEAAAENLSMKILDGAKGVSTKGASRLETEIVIMQDLQGSQIGGVPAKVAFRMAIYPPGANLAVWRSNYFFQQESISDNWLKVGERFGAQGSGAGWISALEIFKRGVSQALQDFNARRDAQFQGLKAAPQG